MAQATSRKGGRYIRMPETGEVVPRTDKAIEMAEKQASTLADKKASPAANRKKGE